MLSLVGKLIRVSVGFVLSIIVASTIQVLFVLLPTDQFTLIGADWSEMWTWLLWIVETSWFYGAFAFLPAVALIFISEATSIRSLSFYVLASLAVAVGGFAYLARTGTTVPSFVVTFTIAAFLVSGIAAGFAYWLISGQFAGKRRSDSMLK